MNIRTVVGSWIMISAILGVPIVTGLLLMRITGLIIGSIVGGILLYLASDGIDNYIRLGYPVS
jgi:hypothetical protein